MCKAIVEVRTPVLARKSFDSFLALLDSQPAKGKLKLKGANVDIISDDLTAFKYAIALPQQEDLCSTLKDAISVLENYEWCHLEMNNLECIKELDINARGVRDFSAEIDQEQEDLERDIELAAYLIGADCKTLLKTVKETGPKIPMVNGFPRSVMYPFFGEYGVLHVDYWNVDRKKGKYIPREIKVESYMNRKNAKAQISTKDYFLDIITNLEKFFNGKYHTNLVGPDHSYVKLELVTKCDCVIPSAMLHEGLLSFDAADVSLEIIANWPKFDKNIPIKPKLIGSGHIAEAYGTARLTDKIVEKFSKPEK